MKHPLNNNRGAALVFVMVTLIIVAILGTSALTMSRAETNISVAGEKNLQADYIARAGADIAARYLIENPMATIPAAGITITESMGAGGFTAKITELNAESVKIVSTGSVDTFNASDTISLVMEKVEADYKALFGGVTQSGDTKLDLSGLEIFYDKTDPDGMPTITTSHSDYQLSHLNKSGGDYPIDVIQTESSEAARLKSATVPDTSDYEKTVPGNKILKGNYDIPAVTAGLTFDTEGGEQFVVTETIDLGNPGTSVYVRGGGVVHLFVNDDTDVIKGNFMTDDQDGIIVLYLEKGTTLHLQTKHTEGSAKVFIYGPEARIKMHANAEATGSIIGELITNKQEGSPAGDLFYYPFPNMSASGIGGIGEGIIEPSFIKVMYSQ